MVVQLSIREAAEVIGCSPSTIRLWEQHGLVAPDRKASAHRRYGEDDLARLRHIAYLRRQQKLNLPAIKRVLGGVTVPEQGNRQPELALGSRLRELRQSKGLALQQVADANGLSRSFLSMLERGHTGASIVNLKALLDFYGTTLAGLFEAGAGGGHLTRPGERWVLDDGLSGIQIEHLTSGAVQMEVQVFRARPGASSEGSYSHEGEEFIYMLAGTIEVVLAESDQYELRTGDCLYFPSTAMHSWRNTGDELAVMLWVNTPPSF
jgi:DNA-binding transcriptional MerR regulator/quercetin dioxygenase-like cupin family protein